MKVKMSEYLSERKPIIKTLVASLSQTFEYVSVLGTDVAGKDFNVRDRSTSAMDYMLNERGFVARVYRDGKYFEYSFNEIPSGGADELAEKIREAAAAAPVSAENITYPLIAEDEITKSFSADVGVPPEAMTSGEKLDRLRAINKSAHEYSDLIVDFITGCTTVHVSKIFISSKKNLEQSYIWSQAMVAAVVRRGDITKFSFAGCSGLKGLEIFDEMENKAKEAVDQAIALLDAKPIPPGEYEVVCAPLAVGIIAHEAFGHGVEMDMFVKNRAKAVEYLGKSVASPLVTMRDGSTAAKNTASYMFDDEGTIGGDTVIIKDGILQTGISDILSALSLGKTPTGNGRRESFARKAYSRMTNTFFQPGTDKLEDMIASVKHGYLIERASSGMEDPKDWGIQVMFESAKEIIDGKLTGNVVAPVIMTGYVPDLLSNISMVSDDFELSGSGFCGKGYKELVKVSEGGPYIKTKARLG